MSRSFATDERVLEAVAQTHALSAENFGAVCKLAVRLFGSDKQSKRRLTRTASASGWETEQMERAVLAIAKVLMDGAKAEMSERAFRLVLKGMTLSDEHVEVLAQIYEAHSKSIRECVSRETGTSVPHYRNLEWRIDLELGTRFHRNKPKPIVTLRLDTATQTSSFTVPQVASTCFRVDYDGLKVIQRQLETALKEVDSVHCSRIQRYMH
ncbi:COMM domain containing protein 2 [Phytophthora palmivora]|uniref:COMM domain containing protein 2 n=1 Tax=Phytophthora palmivora TaxID=4796 RepID=A0A2P4YIT4_9STRA|nr:COMM domain containing protein 2 [Phytophthora palmivora]